MDGNLEKECSALGGLFQCIVNDLKNGYPVWEDFAQKATKMHAHLKATVTAVNSFLDALQRVADLATNAKGATRDIGTALTRICMRHRSIENRLKTLSRYGAADAVCRKAASVMPAEYTSYDANTALVLFFSALIDCLVLPLQEKLDDWRRSVATMDKDHAREYKRARAEIKKRSSDSGRLQKKVRKGQNAMQRMLESAVQEVSDRYCVLLETERLAVRQALIEQRSQFCIFVSWFKPVMDGELSLLNEMSQLQEVVQLLYKYSADPFALPPSSEAVIADVKGLESTWRYQTPPSSPGSSLCSRKSSYCSLSSAESSSQAQMPIPKHPMMPIPASPRYSSTGSQDSGFTSQDPLHQMLRRPAVLPVNKQLVGPDADGSTEESCDSQQSTPSPSPSSATWPDGGAAAGVAAMQRIVQITPPLQRPHTISAAYGAQSAKRPTMNTATFAPPRPTNLFKESPKTKRSSSQDPGAQRPPLPQQPRPPGAGRTSATTTPVIPDFNRVRPNQVIPQPVYANVQELKRASGGEEMSAADRMVALRQSTIIRQRIRRPLSFASADDAASLLGMALDGGGGGVFIDDDEDTLIGDVDQLSHQSNAVDAAGSLDSYCTLPHSANAGGHPMSKGGVTTPLATSSLFGVIRRQPSSGHAPPPPVRRNSSITAATPTAPAVDIIRSRCASPEQDLYATVERRPATTPVVGGEYAVASRRFDHGFRATSEPPIQKTDYSRQQRNRAPAVAASARESLLVEIRSGIRPRSTAGPSGNVA